MAREGAPYPVPSEISTKIVPRDWRAYALAMDEFIKGLQAEDRLVYWPVADGRAYYYVQSVKPPVLRHINIGDGWRVNSAMIRGLRAVDLEDELRRHRGLRELFKKKEDGA